MIHDAGDLPQDTGLQEFGFRIAEFGLKNQHPLTTNLKVWFDQHSSAVGFAGFLSATIQKKKAEGGKNTPFAERRGWGEIP